MDIGSLMSTTTPAPFTVEVEILADVYRRARDMQRRQAEGEEPGITMAWVGRRIIRVAASGLPDPVTADVPDPEVFLRMLDLPPADRPWDAPRKVFRFRMSAKVYAQAVGALAEAERCAKDRLPRGLSKENGRRSVARWLEYHLDIYADTGKIE